jgi:hypothetical protein
MTKTDWTQTRRKAMLPLHQIPVGPMHEIFPLSEGSFTIDKTKLLFPSMKKKTY